LPGMGAGQDRQGEVGWVERRESGRRLEGETAHRLNGFAREPHDLDAVMPVPAELRKCVRRLPIGETRYR